VKTAMVDNVKDAQAGRREAETPVVAAAAGPLGWWARAKDFLVKVREEVGRVSWPTQREVQATTIVVIAFSLIMGIYLFAVDAAFNKLVEWIFRRFGGAA
jgi:preprotein translocase subunit SecE